MSSQAKYFTWSVQLTKWLLSLNHEGSGHGLRCDVGACDKASAREKKTQAELPSVVSAHVSAISFVLHDVNMQCFWLPSD
jgi:hypothetical protein